MKFKTDFLLCSHISLPAAYIIDMENKVAFVYCNKKFYITTQENIVTVFCSDGSLCVRHHIAEIEKDSRDPFLQLITAVYHALF